MVIELLRLQPNPYRNKYDKKNRRINCLKLAYDHSGDGYVVATLSNFFFTFTDIL